MYPPAYLVYLRGFLMVLNLLRRCFRGCAGVVTMVIWVLIPSLALISMSLSYMPWIRCWH